MNLYEIRLLGDADAGEVGRVAKSIASRTKQSISVISVVVHARPTNMPIDQNEIAIFVKVDALTKDEKPNFDDFLGMLLRTKGYIPYEIRRIDDDALSVKNDEEVINDLKEEAVGDNEDYYEVMLPEEPEDDEDDGFAQEFEGDN